jgi:hypothetical protein
VLVDFYQRHILVLASARAGRTELTHDELADHALAALSFAAALIDDLREEQGPIVRDALERGADPSAVAAAMGVEPEDVAGGGSRHNLGASSHAAASPGQS